MLPMSHLLGLEGTVPWSLAVKTRLWPLHGWQRMESKEGGLETPGMAGWSLCPTGTT